MEAQQLSIKKAVLTNMSVVSKGTHLLLLVDHSRIQGVVTKLCVELAQKYGTISSMLTHITGIQADALVPALRTYVMFNETLFSCITLKYLGSTALDSG